MPSIAVPEPTGAVTDGDVLLQQFEDLFNRQQQVNEAAALVVDYVDRGNDQDRLMAVLGKALLREDRNFHTQTYHIARRLHRGERLYQDA